MKYYLDRNNKIIFNLYYIILIIAKNKNLIK